jgi:predicted CopG family antitoxin
MALLNPHRLYWLYTERRLKGYNGYLEYRPSSTGTMMRDWSDRDYFYVEYRQGNCFDAFPLDNLMMPHELKALKNGQIMLALNNTHEAFHLPVEQLYKSLVLNEGIPPENILLISESADIADEVARCAELFNVGKMKAEWILQFEFNMQRDMVQNWGDRQHLPTLEVKQYPKKFLNFNRRWRPHRVMLVALYRIFNLLKHGHVSLGANDQHLNWERMVPDLKNIARENEQLLKLIEDNEDALLNIPPLYLDTNDLITNHAELQPGTDFLYSESLVSVVTETNFFTGFGFEIGRFLSEKTFKPIAKCHPFIIASVPRMLDKLRELGYKSFSPYIDESYDLETNDNLRLLKIVKELERISNMSDSEVEQFIHNVRPICEHNRNVLLDKKTFIHRLN